MSDDLFDGFGADDGAVANVPADVDFDEDDPFGDPHASSAVVADDADPFGAPAGDANNDSNVLEFGPDDGDEDDLPPADEDPFGSAAADFGPGNAADPFEAAAEETQPAAEEVEEEPAETPLSIWQAKRREELDAKRIAEREEKMKLGERSTMETEAFYKERKQAIESRQSKNKKDEADFLADLESVMQYGTLWEKVAKLVDLKPKSGKDESEVARMRQLLVQLKNENVKDVARA